MTHAHRMVETNPTGPAVNAVLLKGVEKDLGKPDTGKKAQPMPTT